ncbi:glycoside hydrolase family 3 N-terminal domain-containing protein [Sphingobium aromaticiconvertens]|uniref:glycoside hydrolase family 3 N-terminal domain-containing protein n=1 Tax=Sphingobium aromaticiconvertens TaxID=365341 RepID=UPI003016A110
MSLDRRQIILGALSGAMTLGVPARLLAQTDVARVDALIGKMTLEEKAGQMTCLADSFRPYNPPNPEAGIQNEKQLAQEIVKGRVGCLFNGIGVAGGLRAQEMAVKESRLGIPLLLAGDVIHGLKTIFPVPLAEAASFDPALAERTARAMALEATAAGLHLTFAPMVDIARDQRWGRVVEGSGEDLYLGRLYAAARVRGFQGRNLRRDDSLLACPKHFAAYGAVAAGMEYGSVDISEETLRETHLPPFDSAFAAGALTTMAAFSEINGVPATADRTLLTDILRGEMTFRGFVFSDYTADEELIAHGYAEDERDAARLAVLAGVDMSMQSGLYVRHLPDLVKSGAVPMGTIDVAVRRILYVKTAIGLFDNPYRSLDPAAETARIGTSGHRALARESAARSIVLLQNKDAVLPLGADDGEKIALIGPFAEDRDNLYGPWAFYGDKGKGVDIATGMRAAMRDPTRLMIEPGCAIDGPLDGGLARAVEAAKAADVVVLAIGESQDMSGEAQSRTTIEIPLVQQALAEAVAATGKPVIVLLRHGRALALHGAVANAQAILATWFLGSEAGHAIADILFGRVDPSAKLPVSFPWESGQEPFFYDRKSTGRPVVDQRTEYKARYATADNSARFPFGHGLTYTDLVLDKLKLSDAALRWDQAIEVRATLTNKGKRRGTQAVQLYLRDRVASRTRPIRELKRIERVTLNPGDSKVVRFSISRADLSFIGAGNKRIVEPGLFDLWIGDSSIGGLHTQFTLYAGEPAAT